MGLSTTRCISSIGVLLLMKALKVVMEQKGRPRFLNASVPVAGVLEISGLSDHAYSGSEPDAVGLLRK